MKPNRKSALFCALAAFLFPLCLQGCADVALPTWLTGEPDAATLAAPRAVGHPEGKADKTYPSLREVPAMPGDFTAKDERKSKIDALSHENSAGQARAREVAAEAEAEKAEAKARAAAASPFGSAPSP